ncbi:MAG: hypothetical protein OEV64_00160 [Desulfobulbaceae bacterium]|nr:hypothetical protein [Desulfobulbaceae bacterium]
MSKQRTAITLFVIAASFTFGCVAKNSNNGTAGYVAPTLPAETYQQQVAADGKDNPFFASTASQQEPIAPSQYDAPAAGQQPTQMAPSADSPWEMEPNAVREQNMQNRQVVGGPNLPDTGQVFNVKNLPDAIAVNTHTIEKNTINTQPLLEHLRITGLRLLNDGKAVTFNVENGFNRTNAKAINTGGLMLTAMVKYANDDSGELRSCVLFKEKRLTFQKGVTTFTTDPANYPQVASIESLQFFFIPTKVSQTGQTAMNGPKMPDTSQVFRTGNLPKMIAVDPYAVAQHSQGKDPRLGFLRILNMRSEDDGQTFDFTIENTFDRQEAEPIHVGSLMITGMARYNYDNGAELHSCILFEEKHMTLDQGITNFKTDPTLYPGVKEVETVQIFFTP